MIILEGPDGGGKSTLARALNQRLDWPVYKIGSSPTDSQLEEFMLTCYQRAKTPCIQDRVTQISELVYSEVFGRRRMAQTQLVAAIVRLLKDCSPLIIYARVANLDFVQHTREEYETQEYIDSVSQRLPRIRDLYDEILLDKHMLPYVLVYDYTTISTEEFIDADVSPRLSQLA